MLGNSYRLEEQGNTPIKFALTILAKLLVIVGLYFCMLTSGCENGGVTRLPVCTPSDLGQIENPLGERLSRSEKSPSEKWALEAYDLVKSLRRYHEVLCHSRMVLKKDANWIKVHHEEWGDAFVNQFAIGRDAERDLWRIWRVCGYCGFADMDEGDVASLDHLNKIADRYQRFIEKNKHLPEREIQEAGLLQAIELLKTDYARPALSYIFSSVSFDVYYHSTAPLSVLPGMSIKYRDKLHEWFSSWKQTGLASLRWHEGLHQFTENQGSPISAKGLSRLIFQK